MCEWKDLLYRNYENLSLTKVAKKNNYITLVVIFLRFWRPFFMQENIWWHHLENNGARVLRDTGEDRRVIHTWIWAQGLLPLLVHPGWAALDSGAEPPRETPFAADLHCNTKTMKGQQSESSPTMGEERAEASACCKIFTNFTMNIKWASNENWC